MLSHGTHLGIRDKIKIYALPKAICNRPVYFARKIGFGLSAFYIHFHKWLTFNECGPKVRLAGVVYRKRLQRSTAIYYLKCAHIFLNFYFHNRGCYLFEIILFFRVTTLSIRNINCSFLHPCRDLKFQNVSSRSNQHRDSS